MVTECLKTLSTERRGSDNEKSLVHMANAVFSQDEADAIIKTRFITSATVGRGEPPLKRLIKRFVELADRVGGDGASYDDASEDALKALLREIGFMEIQAQKYNAIISAQKMEQAGYVEKQTALLEHVEEVKRDIEAKKVELAEARIARQHMEEYEVLRSKISEIPSRSVTKADTERVIRQMKRIEQEGVKYSAVMERKRKQYGLLFHVLEDLHRSPDDESEALLASEGAGAATAAAGGGAAAAALGEGLSSVEAMELDDR